MNTCIRGTQALTTGLGALAVLLIAAAPVADEPPPSATISVRVVQLRQAPSATPDGAPANTPDAVQPQPLAAEKDPPEAARSGRDPVVFTADTGKNIVLAGQVLPATRCDAHDPSWVEIAAPRVSCAVGQAASVRVGQVVPYMTQRADGSLIVEHTDAIEGLTLDLRVTEAQADAVTLESLVVKLTRVVAREQIRGVPFDVGRPILRTMETQTSLRLAPDKQVIIALPTSADDERPVFVLVQASANKAP